MACVGPDSGRGRGKKEEGETKECMSLKAREEGEGTSRGKRKDGRQLWVGGTEPQYNDSVYKCREKLLFSICQSKVNLISSFVQPRSLQKCKLRH